MCGFVGFYSPMGLNESQARPQIKEMTEKLIHRGPDDEGYWIDGDSGIALGHRRLSILDLSKSGSQPISSFSGRYILAFNGEIYNHLELRNELIKEGLVSWKGDSDTATLINALEHWGLEKVLSKIIGMFSFAVWDRKERELHLARDRMGEKPLYFGWQNGIFLFGSELKAMLINPSFKREVFWDVFPLYLKLGYIPSPWSIWKGIFKLKPGCTVKISREVRNIENQQTPYWSLIEVIVKGQSSPFELSDREATDILEKKILSSLSGQRIADVPLGAFLSGGTDSSLVVALLQKNSLQPVNTFSIGFEEQQYNEAKYAKLIAQHLGTNHTEYYVSEKDALQTIPKLNYLYDEPFGDSSAIPTILVSQLARQNVTVALSGDGGDELFGGYKRYFNTKYESLWRTLHRVPNSFYPVLDFLVQSKFPSLLDITVLPLQKLVNIQKANSYSYKADLISGFLKIASFVNYYQLVISQWKTHHEESKLHIIADSEKSIIENLNEPIHQMMAIDCLTYLPNDILTKIDRASMSVSLETRVPLLDYRIVEFAWQLPISHKIRSREGKWILKQILYKYVPKHLLDRPKMGFGVPIDKWIKNSLNDWADNLIHSENHDEAQFLDKKLVEHRWNNHMNGKFNYKDSLWTLLMWRDWMSKNL